MNGPMSTPLGPRPNPKDYIQVKPIHLPENAATFPKPLPAPVKPSPRAQSFPEDPSSRRPVRENAEVLFDDDRIVDPIDQSVPSMPTHATVQDFGSPYGETPDSSLGEENQLTAILQGLLGNMSIDPLAVERNTSLAEQYLDAMQKKVGERQRVREKAEMKAMAGAVMGSTLNDDDDGDTEYAYTDEETTAPNETVKEGKDAEPSDESEGPEPSKSV